MSTATSLCHHRLPDGVHHLELNRPERRNALGVRDYAALADTLERLAQEDRRVVVLSGRGAGFCAGNDLHEFGTEWPQPAHGPVYRFLEALHACSCPVIAAVQGAAIGIGATMLLHADLVLMQRGSYLKFPFVDLGISVEGGASWLLPERLGHARAMDLLLTGRRVACEEAWQLGLASTIVDDGVVDHALAQARAIAGKPVAAVSALKAQCRSRSRSVFPALFEDEIQAINTLLVQGGATAVRSDTR